ncbi:MAG: metallophosphoesterase [Thermodesulfobacteriota bacterium]
MGKGFLSKKFSRRDFFKHSMRGMVLVGVGKGFYNTTEGRIRLQRVSVPLPGLPPAFSGLKIAQLSDLHSSRIVRPGLIEEAARLVMNEKPDLIVLTGDYITGEILFLSKSVGEFKKLYLDRCLDALSGLNAPMGIYAVLGNHDFWSGSAALSTIVKGFEDRIGAKWLRNSSVRLRRGASEIQLLGIDDYWENSSSLDRALEGLTGDKVRILLSHNPDINAAIESRGERIDLVLSGHTHGGQVALPVVGAPFLPSEYGQKYRKGLVSDPGRFTYINSGVGNLLFPIRFNSPPEAALITLEMS